MAGGAIDEDPAGWLPDPVLAGLGGEGVVDVEDASDGEGAIGDGVLLADGPLLELVVDDERANFEGGAVVVFGIGRGEGRGVGNLADGAEADGVDLRLGGGRGGEGVLARDSSRTA